MLSALFVGILASSALVIGGVTGAFWNPPQKLIASLLAFASGALITALAFELFEEAFKIAGPWLAGSGLLMGALVFLVATALLDRYASSTSGFYLLASILLDGVPENLALGVALIGKSLFGILTLLIAIFFSNFPESLAGAAGMIKGGRSKKFAYVASCYGSIRQHSIRRFGQSSNSDGEVIRCRCCIGFAG